MTFSPQLMRYRMNRRLITERGSSTRALVEVRAATSYQQVQAVFLLLALPQIRLSRVSTRQRLKRPGDELSNPVPWLPAEDIEALHEY